MALAEFFDKAALAAADVIQGFTYQKLAARLEEEVVCVAFDASACAGEGSVTLDLLVNLLARLYPRLALRPLGLRTVALAADLEGQARRINPLITWEAPDGATRTLVVGRTALSEPAIYVGSQGWTATVQTTGEVGSGLGDSPFGAAVAACLGASVLFRQVFNDVLPPGQAEGCLSWQLYDNGGGELPDLALRDTYLAGVGAVGNAVVWTLARMPSLRGALHLVDPQPVALSNIQRYILAHREDVDRPKVDLATEALRSTNLTIIPHQTEWAVAAADAQYKIGPVAVALDSAEGRQEVQAALPLWTVNAWTQSGDLGVSRHDFLDANACLMCLYLPTSARPNQDLLVTTALGLSADKVQLVRGLLATHQPVHEDFLTMVAQARGIQVEPLLSFVGKPLQVFYSEGVCGGLILRLGGVVTAIPTATAPLAHQSALAGVLLAAELVLKSAGMRSRAQYVSTRYDVIHPFRPPVSAKATKMATGHCICQDQDYIAAYTKKHTCMLGSAARSASFVTSAIVR